MPEKSEKVELAIIDTDLKARTFKKFPVSSDGRKIDVISGGKGYFMPQFDNDSFIELPRPWYLGGGWKRIHIAVRGAKACFRFRKTKNSHLAEIKTITDLEELIAAASSDPPIPEALFKLQELLKVAEIAGDEDFSMPDPQQVIDAAKAEMIKNFGKEKQEKTMVDWLQLGLIVFLLLLQLGVI